MNPAAPRAGLRTRTTTQRE